MTGEALSKQPRASYKVLDSINGQGKPHQRQQRRHEIAANPIQDRIDTLQDWLAAVAKHCYEYGHDCKRQCVEQIVRGQRNEGRGGGNVCLENLIDGGEIRDRKWDPNEVDDGAEAECLHRGQLRCAFLRALAGFFATGNRNQDKDQADDESNDIIKRLGLASRSEMCSSPSANTIPTQK